MTTPPSGLISRATARELAPVLTAWSPMAATGQREITVRLIDSWHEHRHNTGMPAPVGKEARGRHRHSRVWDVAEVLAWYLEWEPLRGGAPSGNLNSMRHGRYLGMRAER